MTRLCDGCDGINNCPEVARWRVQLGVYAGSWRVCGYCATVLLFSTTLPRSLSAL